MKAAVIVFPASNCDRDAAVALAQVTGRAPTMVWHKEASLPDLDLIVLPGGFAHGDYLRAGAMAARAPVMRAVARAAGRGVAVLGICNGFQVLTEAGLLPGALMRNAGLTFVHRMVNLKVEQAETIFTRRYRPGEVFAAPVAHHDGCYYADDETLARLEGEGLIALRYVGPDGYPSEGANPNGSLADIAGILGAGRRILGLMPHPERASDPALGAIGGLALFAGLAEALS
jgi:phosphoribosylformylglycinamidine synthase